MVKVIAVHMVGGNQHEHIADIKWQNATQTGESTRAGMVSYINGGGKAYVSDGTTTVEVGVVQANPPYIRTHADSKWSDNLLSLPRY